MCWLFTHQFPPSALPSSWLQRFFAAFRFSFANDTLGKMLGLGLSVMGIFSRKLAFLLFVYPSPFGGGRSGFGFAGQSLLVPLQIDHGFAGRE